MGDVERPLIVGRYVHRGALGLIESGADFPEGKTDEEIIQFVRRQLDTMTPGDHVEIILVRKGGLSG